MRAAVEGDWSFTITPQGGTATQVTLHIEQAATAADAGVARTPTRGLLRAAYACGTRTLVKSAGACIDLTQMPLALTFVSGDATLGGGHLSGILTVDGLILYLCGRRSPQFSDRPIRHRIDARAGRHSGRSPPRAGRDHRVPGREPPLAV